MATPVKKSTWGNFTPVKETMPHRLIWRSYGPEKSGKNHFGLTAPGPVAIQCFDVLGLEGTVEKFRAQGKDIHVCKYHLDINDSDVQQMAKNVLTRFTEDFEVAQNNARTIQWDETELWRVFRYAELGDKSATPSAYDAVNFKYAEMIHQVDDTNVNFQLIQKVKEKWNTVEEVNREGRKVSKGRPSGQMVPTGMKEVQFLVQANISHTWDKENGFGVHIANCRQNMAIAGESYYGVEFAEIAQLVFPESDESDWQ